MSMSSIAFNENLVASTTSGTSGILTGILTGDIIICLVSFTTNNAETVFSVTDTLGSFYERVIRIGAGALSVGYEIWWAIAPANGNNTITATWTLPWNVLVSGAVFRSTLGTSWNPHTSSSFAQTTNVTTHNCAAVGAIDTTIAETLIIGGGCLNGTGAATPAAGFTSLSTGISTRGYSQYKLATATETDQRAAWTSGTARSSYNALVAFAIFASTSSGRISQLPVEVGILSDAPISARVSQLPVEVAILSDVPISAQLSQLPIEILVNPTVVPSIPGIEVIHTFVSKSG